MKRNKENAHTSASPTIRKEKIASCLVGGWLHLHAMNLAHVFAVLAVLTCICGAADKGLSSEYRDSKLERYFKDYCDQSGNLGIGIVPSHTYDYKFRQRLKTTSDTELKRLFVLRHLYRDLEIDMRDFESVGAVAGKERTPKMTRAERASKLSSIKERLDDLAILDPDDPFEQIADFRKRLSRVSR